MKILMLAPEPFFQPRGTPISVYFRTMALTSLGHEVDCVTYPLGEEVRMENLRILRLPNFLRLRKIKIGPSAAKVPLDAALTLKALGRIVRSRYDLVYSHEEAAFPGVLLSKLARVPHLYDMHSSLPQQLENFEFTRSPLLKRLFARMERFVLRNSHAVIVICPDLLDKVRAEGFGDKTILIENVLDFPAPETGPGELERLKIELASGGEKIILYAGNFGPYQGVSLLVEAAAHLREKAVLVLLGGSPDERAELEAKAAGLGLAGRVVVLDRVAPTRVPLFVKAADVLVSPRMSGTNTPLKIYSFLKSGKPLVATRLYTHTQVLDDTISVLVEPTPEAMAAGLDFALKDPEAKRRAAAAAALAEREYTFAAYRDRIVRCLGMAMRNFGR
ncbi:MAG TPA: glycosyltransferase family 4 protein [Acidobacteriota bacterium]|nr:glycosyltransferase family 4 protein [Acidobacteriota bacterium]